MDPRVGRKNHRSDCHPSHEALVGRERSGGGPFHVLLAPGCVVALSSCTVMASTAIPEAVFLDTHVFDAASFNFKSTPFAALTKHLDSGRLRLLMTDITVGEVRARIGKDVAKEVTAHNAFRKQARTLRSCSLPAAAGAVAELDEGAIAADLCKAFDNFLEQHKADILDTSEQDAGPVFEKYFASAPPFGSGDKKSEFPDAFVIEALIEWTEDNGEELLVVSGDEPIRAACDDCDELHPFSNLAALLDHVASDDEKLASFIRAQLVAQSGEIAKTAKSKYEDLGFSIQDEWGDAEPQVTSIELEGEPEILDISGKEATVQMTFKASIDLSLSYDDRGRGPMTARKGGCCS